MPVFFVPFLATIVVTSTIVIGFLLKRKFNKKRRHRLIRKTRKRKSEEMCVICHEDFLSNTKISTMYCNHTYHHNCLDDWLLERESCPLCNIDHNDIVSNITKK
jgi:hypothetical protein